MCNCGKKPITNAIGYNNNPVYHQPNIPPVQQGIRFQYTGATALTAIGNATGRRYRFNHPNDTQLIDEKDAAAMRKVPILRQV